MHSSENLVFPEMGTKVAAVGTLVARILELVIVVIYLIFQDHKLKLFCKDLFRLLQKKHFHAFSRFCGHPFYQIRYGHLRHRFKQES